jgi:hypothetical protein
MQQMREAFPWEPRRDMCCAIEMPSTGETSRPWLGIWEWRKYLLLRDPPGKIPLLNGWWALFDASVWTT